MAEKPKTTTTLKSILDEANLRDVKPSTEILFDIGDRRCRPQDVKVLVNRGGYNQADQIIVSVSDEQIEAIVSRRMKELLSGLVDNMFKKPEKPE